jgi:hypothetical protein
MDEVVDEKYLYHSIKASARNLNSCHIVVAQRGAAQPDLPGVPSKQVVFSEFWIVGDDIQCREKASPTGTANAPWWAGFKPNQAPVNSATLTSSIAKGEVLRLHLSKSVGGERYTYTPARDKEPYPGILELNRPDGAVSSGFLPLVGLDREWTIATTLLEKVIRESKLDDWAIVGEEQIVKKKAIKVKVRSSAQQVHSTPRGDLGITAIWYVWFSKEDRYAPIRIEETLEYTLEGKAYPYQRAPTQRQYIASYEAMDFKEFPGEIFYPQSGREEVFLPDMTASLGFNGGEIADQILSKGSVIDPTPHYPYSNREWHVLELEYLDPATDLRCDPPDGVVVRDYVADRISIQGKTDEESKELLGMLPSGISSANMSSTASATRRLLICANVIIVCVLVIWAVRKRQKVNDG